MTETGTITAKWLSDPSVQAIFDALEGGGEDTRIVGGAVRNHLLGQPVGDVDFATTCVPDETARRLTAAGIKPVPTGIEHGTVTAVIDGAAFEITTLRKDIETDGRHAVVAFGRDWKEDSQRRDFTVNALYCDRDGKLHDPCGGMADIRTSTIRFIGEAEERIAEDHLRVLRFFRFFAWYGSGRPDADGLKACVRAKDGLDSLSAERVWQEMRKLFAAPDPSRAILWMRQTGVLTRILPESEKWGIDAIHGLIEAESAFGWTPDPVLRLMSLVPPQVERVGSLSVRWKLPNVVRDRLDNWANLLPVVAEESAKSLRHKLYFDDRQAVLDRLRLDIAAARKSVDMADADRIETVGALALHLKAAETFVKPVFPVSGTDIMATGIQAGPGLGKALKLLKRRWVDGGFVESKESLIASLASSSGA